MEFMATIVTILLLFMGWFYLNSEFWFWLVQDPILVLLLMPITGFVLPVFGYFLWVYYKDSYN